MVEDASEAFEASPSKVTFTDSNYAAPYIERWPIRVRLLILLSATAASWGLIYAILHLLR